jgi:hypothetical protein
LVVLLLLAVEVLHGFDHVELLETFGLFETVDLAAEGFGLVQQLEAKWISGV